VDFFDKSADSLVELLIHAEGVARGATVVKYFSTNGAQ